MKVEEPKKEAKKKRQNSTDSSDTPLKGKRRSGAGGSEDCSKETITLIYPRDAQSTIFILYLPTRKAREPIEKGSAPLDGETPIGSI